MDVTAADVGASEDTGLLQQPADTDAAAAVHSAAGAAMYSHRLPGRAVARAAADPTLRSWLDALDAQDPAFMVDEDGQAGNVLASLSSTRIDADGNVFSSTSSKLLGKISEMHTATHIKMVCKCKLHTQCSVIKSQSRLPEGGSDRFRQWLAAGVKLTGRDRAEEHKNMLPLFGFD